MILHTLCKLNLVPKKTNPPPHVEMEFLHLCIHKALFVVQYGIPRGAHTLLVAQLVLRAS